MQQPSNKADAHGVADKRRSECESDIMNTHKKLVRDFKAYLSFTMYALLT